MGNVGTFINASISAKKKYSSIENSIETIMVKDIIYTGIIIKYRMKELSVL